MVAETSCHVCGLAARAGAAQSTAASTAITMTASPFLLCRIAALVVVVTSAPTVLPPGRRAGRPCWDFRVQA